MILGQLKRTNVKDDKLWTLIERVNKLSGDEPKTYEDNAQLLMPLLDRILICSRENEDWQVYFYTMAQFLWLVLYNDVKDIRRAFQISEMFHRRIMQGTEEDVSSFAKEWMVNIAAKILVFYLDYPQVNDEKLDQMLNLFLDLDRRYNSSRNCEEYYAVMWTAQMNRDKKLAEVARKRLSQARFEGCCYICYYCIPMIDYSILHDDAERVEEIILSVTRRTIPGKYQWCYAQCRNADEKELVDYALEKSLNYGSHAMFKQIFLQWNAYYQKPESGKEKNAYQVLFHALAGDFSWNEERMHLAEKDDRNMGTHRESPLCSIKMALCWYVYFQMLGKNGVKSVQMKLGNGNQPGNATQPGDVNQDMDKGKAGARNENRFEWTCLNAAAYFERQADAIGAQMDEGRKRFNYGEVKKRYEECFLEE